MSSKSNPEMFEALHPDPDKKGARVTKATYDAYRSVLLDVIPADENGVFLSDLNRLIEPHLPSDIIENTSIMWWIMCVKLDLEARSIIERVPGKGKQRVRKIANG